MVGGIVSDAVCVYVCVSIRCVLIGKIKPEQPVEFYIQPVLPNLTPQAALRPVSIKSRNPYLGLDWCTQGHDHS